MSYKLIFTNIGLAKIQNAELTGDFVDIEEFAVGDGVISDLQPTLTGLLSEKYRALINQVSTTNGLTSFDLVIPSEVGGFYIREVALYDVDGDCICIGTVPVTYKVNPSEGASKPVHIRVSTATSNVDNLQLSYDNSQVYVNYLYVDDKLNQKIDKDIYEMPDINANLTDIDLIIVDDGANGTNRKSAISRIWTYVSGKLTGAISTVLTSNVTASRALVSDSNGKISASSITSTILGYLSNVTSDVQTQIDAKAPLASPTFTGDPKSVTPAQFDNDTSVATTAFVQRALGNYQKNKDITSSITLLASDAGSFVNIYGTTGNITITLPSSSSVPIGGVFDFFNSSANNATIQRNGTDVIYVSSSTINSLVITSGDTLKLVSLGGTGWLAISGTAQMKYSNGFFGSSLSGSGYQKFPSGLIIQWANATSSASGFSSWNFPISFPNSCLNVYGTMYSANSNSVVAVVNVLSNSGATFATVNSSNAFFAGTARLLAIGH